MVMNTDDERAKEVTGRKKMTILQLRFPQPLGRPWACLLWGQPAWLTGRTSHLFTKKAPGALPFQIFLWSILQILVGESFEGSGTPWNLETKMLQELQPSLGLGPSPV